jgi:hypothetical protein
MDSLLAIEHYLTQVRNRDPDAAQDKQMRECLQQLKNEAVAGDDQEQAKRIWCYETVQRTQNQFIAAFQMMQGQYFYPAWCMLERVEINLGFLERHFDLNASGSDAFLLCFIKKHTEQFQSLFPYQMFISPGFVALEKVCTICEKPVSIRQSCGHIVGEIYNGKMCARKITEVQVIEVSFVPNPVQKYSVVFMGNESTDNPVDHYNYWHVDYVVRGLHHPFAAWDMAWIPKKRPIAEFSDVGRNAPCPCGSGNKFKRCCIKKDAIETMHLTVWFSEPVPSDLPSYEEYGFVGGNGTPLRPTEAAYLSDRLSVLEAVDGE